MPEAYCKSCGYNLHGLNTEHCPECGRQFRLGDPKTFDTKPPRRTSPELVLMFRLFASVILILSLWYFNGLVMSAEWVSAFSLFRAIGMTIFIGIVPAVAIWLTAPPKVLALALLLIILVTPTAAYYPCLRQQQELVAKVNASGTDQLVSEARWWPWGYHTIGYHQPSGARIAH